MVGRPRKTREVKELQGTLEKSREIENYAKYEPVRKLPEITKDLNADGKAWFRHYCQVMIDQGLMTTAFISDFENAAYLYQTIKIAQRSLNKEGYIMKMANNYRQISPWWKTLIEATKMLGDFSNRYGLNLAASQKIQSPSIEHDEFDQ